MQRVMIFVDQANFAAAAKKRERQPDLLKLRDYLADASKGRLLLEMVVYLGYPPGGNEPPDNWRTNTDVMKRLQDRLEFSGIMAVKHIGKASGSRDEQGHVPYSSNVDVLMAMDALEFALDANPDVVVLVTGDGDFAYLANKLRRKGIRVEAANIEDQMANVLKRAVNDFINLDDFFNTLEGRPIGDTRIFD